MADFLFQILEGLRIVTRAIRIKFTGIKKYSGSVEEISKIIIEKAYNTKDCYFMVSSGHFCQFYARDFGMICESLINLGYKKKVKDTLKYAMQKYHSAGRITTQIRPNGRPINFPSHSPESAAYMLHSLILLNDKALIDKYKYFFQIISIKIYNEDIDKKTGLLRKDKIFSSMKDYSIRQSSCYNNCLLGMFVKDMNKIGIDTPLTKYNYSKLVKEYFWNGNYFLEDLSGNDIIAGDANTFPFWSGIITDKTMAKKTIASIMKKKLDVPWPLKYTSKEDIPKDFHFADFFVPGYEKDTIWMHLGLCYLKFIEKYDKKLLKKYLKQYKILIQKYGNFYELYFANGKPFKRSLYITDDSMSWVAIFWELYKKYI